MKICLKIYIKIYTHIYIYIYIYIYIKLKDTQSLHTSVSGLLWGWCLLPPLSLAPVRGPKPERGIYRSPRVCESLVIWYRYKLVCIPEAMCSVYTGNTLSGNSRKLCRERNRETLTVLVYIVQLHAVQDQLFTVPPQSRKSHASQDHLGSDFRILVHLWRYPSIFSSQRGYAVRFLKNHIAV